MGVTKTVEVLIAGVCPASMPREDYDAIGNACVVVDIEPENKKLLGLAMRLNKQGVGGGYLLKNRIEKK